MQEYEFVMDYSFARGGELYEFYDGDVIAENEIPGDVIKDAILTNHLIPLAKPPKESIRTDHKRLALADKIALLGELEHERRHCVRSAHVAEDEEQKFFYQVKAVQAQALRRKLQERWLKTGELDWCIVKSAATLKQLNNEVLAEDLDLFSEIESFSDALLSHALEEDLSGCSSCRSEIEETK